MKVLGWLCFALVGLAMFAPMTPAVALTLGQTDTFEDGTTQNWTVAVGPFGASHPAPPVNVFTGGPGGADDNFLLLNAVGGGGPGSKLAVINIIQWAGDYLAAGINGIRMDVNNFGGTDLSLRLLLADPTAGPPENIACSTLSLPVSAGSGWKTIIFPLTPADLTALQGSVLTALTDATELRIFHSLTPTFPGQEVVATLGVDNITAVPVPASLLLLATGLLGLAARRKSFSLGNSGV